MRVPLPHENNVPLINADYCYQCATVVFITLLRARKIVRVKHTTQFAFEKKSTSQEVEVNAWKIFYYYWSNRLPHVISLTGLRCRVLPETYYLPQDLICQWPSAEAVLAIPHLGTPQNYAKFGADCRNRTPAPLIISQPLYPLSSVGINWFLRARLDRAIKVTPFGTGRHNNGEKIHSHTKNPKNIKDK